MSRAYDYFWTSQLLLQHGADPAILNNAGFAANTGLEGDVDPQNPIPALVSAHNINEAIQALEMLEQVEAGGLGKDSLVIAGLTKKKQCDFWTDDIHTRFQAICHRH